MIGFMLIFGTVLSRELSVSRLTRECHEENDVGACLKLCHDRPEVPAPCEKLRVDCEQEVALACEALTLLRERAPRRRW